MADDAQREDRTEQASERRLQQAREEGQIPLGRDAVGVGALLFAAIALAQLAGPLRDEMIALLQRRTLEVGSASLASAAAVGMRLPLLGLCVCAAAALGAVVAGVAQTQGGFWPELAMPDLSRLSGGRLSRLFKREMLVDLGVATVKVVAVLSAMWAAWRDRLPALGSLSGAAPATLLPATAKFLSAGLGRALFVLVALAGADLALQRFRFNAKMKMTKEESKREQKEDAGDPLMRGRRRRKHRELSKGRASVEVPRADALVVNPTHIAISIRYRKSDGRAPRVTAKGKGALAEYMRDLARQNGIPIVQDITLARLLYKRVKVGREVPAETYKAVAAILAFVYRLTRRTA